MSWVEIELGKLGQTYSGLSGKTKEDFGSGKPYIPYLNIFSNSKINPDALELVEISPTENQNKVQYGDIFFTTSSETVEEVGMTSVLLQDLREAYLNSFCFGFRLFDFDTLIPEYAVYLLRSENVRHQISFNGQGSTRYNLSKSQLLKNVVLKIPPKPEQSTIATILSTIDQAIEKTEQLIVKYERIKTGLMQELLTRGIDEQGNIRSEKTHDFKDSPLGRIPREWEVAPFDEFLKVKQYGLSVSSSDEGVPFLRMNNIKEGELYLDDLKYCPGKVDEEHILNDLDILFNRTNSIDYVGRTGIFRKQKIPFTFASYLLRFVPTDEVLPEYLNYWMNLPKNHIRMKTFATQAVQQANINPTNLGKLLVAMPKVEEQKFVVKAIDESRDVIQQVQNDLAKLKSIKTGLMQDLLTGKVRVDALVNN